MKIYILLILLWLPCQGLLYAEHNGNSNVNEATFWLEISLNGRDYPNAPEDDFDYYIKVTGEDQSIGSIDRNGNSSIDPNSQTQNFGWDYGSTLLSLTVYLNDFGLIRLDPDLHSLEITIKQKSTSLSKTKIFGPGEWSMAACYLDINLGMDPPDFGITVDPLQLCEGSTTNNTLTATVTAPPTNYHVEWLKGGVLFTGVTAGGANNSVATVNANCPAGVHTLTAKVIDDDDAANTATCEVVLTVMPTPKVTLTVDKATICKNEAIVLTAGGLNPAELSAHYVWSGGTGTGAISAETFPVDGAKWTENGNKGTLKLDASVTNYKVVGTAANGCSAESPLVAVTVNQLPIIKDISGSPAICLGESTTLVVESPTEGATFKWIQGSTATTSSITVSPSVTTVYQVVVLKDGCATTPVTMTVTVNPIPVVKISGTTKYCFGDNKNVELTASETSGVAGTMSYSWTGPAGGVTTGAGCSYTPVAVGDLTFTVKGTANNCTSAEVTQVVNVFESPKIDQILATAVRNTSTTDACVGEVVELKATASAGKSGYRYDWSGSAVGTGTPLSVTLANNATGVQTYNLKVTDANSCTVTGLTTITGHRVLINNITKSPTGDMVHNSTAVLTPTVTFTPTLTSKASYYDWTPTVATITDAGVSTTERLLKNTIFVLTVTDDYGCSATRNAPEITVSPYTPMAIQLAGAKDYCVGTDIVLTPTVTAGVEPKTYTWTTVTPGGPAIVTSGPSDKIATIAKENLTVGSTYQFNLHVKDGASIHKDTTVTITIREQLDVKISTANLDTCKGKEIALLATPGVANPKTKYAWTGGTTPTNAASVKATITKDGPNVFKVVLTDDAIGCTAMAEVTVNGHSIKLNAPIPLSTPVIYGTAVTLYVPSLECSWKNGCTTPAPKYKYEWSPGNLVASGIGNSTMTTKVLTDLPNDFKFIVDITGDHGCLLKGNYPIKIVGKDLKLVAANDSICFGLTKNVTATVSGMVSNDDKMTKVTWRAIGDATGFTAGTSLAGSTLNTAVLTEGTTYKYEVKTEFLLSGLAWTLMDTAEIYVRTLPTLEPIQVTANGVPVTAVCSGVKLTLTTAGSLTNDNQYTWSGGPAGNGRVTKFTPTTVNVAATPTYKVTASDGKCSVFEEVKITVNPVPTVLTKTQYACGVETIDLTAAGVTTGSTAGLTYTYFTDPGCTTAVAAENAVPNGTYYIVGTTAASCGDTTAVKAVVTPTPTLEVKPAAEKVCRGTDVDLKAQITTIPLPDLTYSYYSDAAGSVTAPQSVNKSGTYYVKGVTKLVTDVTAANCPSPLYPVTVTIDSVKPTLAASVNGVPLSAPVAEGTKVDFTAGPLGNAYTFVKVTSPRTVIQGKSATPTAATIVGKATANYRVIVENAVMGCTDSAQLTVTVNGEKLHIAGTDEAICIGTTDFTGKKVTAQANGGASPYTYVWKDTAGIVLNYTTTPITESSTATFGSIGTLGVGTHSLLVTVTDKNNSKDSTRVKLTINGLPDVRINTKEAGGDTVCQHTADLTLAATGVSGSGTAYKWISPSGLPNGNTQQQTVQLLTAGETLYKVVGTDGNGCSDTASWNVLIHPTPTVALTSDNAVCVGATVTLKATVTGGTKPYGAYVWRGATPLVTTDTAATAVLAVANTFTVEMADANGCELLKDNTLTVTGQSVKAVLLASAAGVPESTSITVMPGTEVTLNAAGSTGVIATYEFLDLKKGSTTSGAASSMKVNPTVNSTYKVVVANAACRDTSALCTVAMDGDPLTVDAQDATICYGETQAILHSNAAGGSGEKVFTWTPLSDNTLVGIPSGQAGKEDLTFTTLSATTPAGRYGFQVKVVAGETKLDTAYLIIQPAATVKLLSGDTCITADGNAVDIRLAIDLKGSPGNNLWVAYTRTAFGGSDPQPVRDSVRVNNNTISLAKGEGRYKIIGIRDGDLKCLGPVEGTPVSFKIGKLPTVEITGGSFATYKDSVFTLKATATGSPVSYSWSREPDPLNEGDGKNYDLGNQKMGNVDMTYIVTAANKNVAICMGIDSITAYRIPDAPQVEIDTNTNKVDIRMHWPKAIMADNYTVWGRKWDPYCLTAEDGGVYQKRATDIEPLEWTRTNAQLDTLEFFYATASRTIPGLGTYVSHASDTVGYVKHKIDATLPLTGASVVYQYAFPYIFDMSRYGCKDLIALGEYFAYDKLSAVGVHDYVFHEAGNWSWETANYMGGGMWISPNLDPMPLKIGDCPMFEVMSGNIIEVVLSGKLKETANLSWPISFTESRTSQNITYIPFRQILKKRTRQIAGGNVDKIAAVGWWSFLKGAIMSDNYLGIGEGMEWGSDMSDDFIFPNRAGYDVIYFDAKGSFVWPESK